MSLADYALRDSVCWLRWLISFYERDLVELRKREAGRLANEIQTFCNIYSDPSITGMVSSSLIKKDLNKLHHELVAIITALISKPCESREKQKGRISITAWNGPTVTVQISLFRKELRAQAVPQEFRENMENLPRDERELLKETARWGKEALSFVDGSIGSFFSAKWPHIFWLALIELLKENGHRLWRCLVCGKLFLKHKRQIFCSARCSQTMRSSRWYERNRPRAQENRRESFKKQQKAKLGHANLRVGRPKTNGAFP